MAILFDWYENPQSSEQQGEENALHPRLRLNGKMSTANSVPVFRNVVR